MRGIERAGRTLGAVLIVAATGSGCSVFDRGGSSTPEPSRTSTAAGEKLNVSPTATLVVCNPSAVTPEAVPTPMRTAQATATASPEATRTPLSTATATARIAESCPRGDWLITDLNGKAIVGVSGVPEKVTSGLDLVDHGIFKPTAGLPNNVLGEPGAFLANRALIAQTESAESLKAWDARVEAGLAEYARPGVNFFDLQTTSDLGVSLNKETGQYEFNLTVPKHVIVRVDFEEGDIYLNSESGDRKEHIQICQSGTGDNKGHQTVFIRTSYEQKVDLRLVSPIPGTQVQVFGLEVKDPTAFASAEAFLQGVKVRQNRADYPQEFVHGFNMNDESWSSSESPAKDAAFQKIGSNYK